MLERAFGQNWKSIAIGIEKKRVELQAEMECLAIMYEENLSELIKTKKALRDTANGRPSEWAYVQLKQDVDKLAEALDWACGHIEGVTGKVPPYLDQALKKHKGTE